MRIHILSDLHNEFRELTGYGAEADVTVLAGDIDLGEKGFAWACAAFTERPVIYIAGNHEYYGHAMPSLTKKLLREKNPGRCGSWSVRARQYRGYVSWAARSGRISKSPVTWRDRCRPRMTG